MNNRGRLCVRIGYMSRHLKGGRHINNRGKNIPVERSAARATHKQRCLSRQQGGWLVCGGEGSPNNQKNAINNFTKMRLPFGAAGVGLIIW